MLFFQPLKNAISMKTTMIKQTESELGRCLLLDIRQPLLKWVTVVLSNVECHTTRGGNSFRTTNGANQAAWENSTSITSNSASATDKNANVFFEKNVVHTLGVLLLLCL
jgi:hypothetical protein